MRDRVSPSAIFVAFAMIAGVLQVLATVRLGTARVDAITRAAGEGASYYLIGGIAIALGLAVTWAVRRRPIVAGLVFIVWQMMVFWPLSRRTTSLGMAYHGEYAMHHFAALMAGAACLAVGWSWSKRKDLPAAKLLPVGLASVGASGLLILHVLTLPAFTIKLGDGWGQAATALLLLAPVTALAIYWKQLAPRQLAFGAAVLLLPLVVRVGVAYPDSLVGAPIPIWARPYLMASVCITAIVVFASFRPDMPRTLRILSIMLSAIATGLLYILYTRMFGELEDGIDGLVQSLFAFPLPYPNYVAAWKIIAVAIAIFFVFATVYSGLLSFNERLRGAAFGLLAITGIGLSNEQLVLMLGAGMLVVVDSLTPDATAAPQADPQAPIEDILAAAAEAIELPPPVVLETATGSVMALRGDVSGASVDIRARPTRAGGWEVTLKAGVRGRTRPEVELVPDASDGGERPPHEIARTHRVKGSVRALEDVGEAPLDSLAPFADAKVRFWPAGAEVEFGRDLSGLDAKGLAKVVRALAALG